MTRTRRTRRGFTLVELMVAAAMSILGMWLLTWLYQQGLDSFRLSNAQSELTNQQAMVKALLIRDLTAQHFLPEDTKLNHGLRLSDQGAAWVNGGTYTVPLGGFFQASSPSVSADVTDTNGFATYTCTSHFIHMTVILPGGSDFQQFSAVVPAGTSSGTGGQNQISGTAAEVFYFLNGNGQTAGGQPLFDLYRRQRICAQTADDAQAYNNLPSKPTQQSDAPDVLVVSSNQMKTLGDLASSSSSFRLSASTPFPVLPATSPHFGEDKLMSNVLSFEVKYTGKASSSTLGWPASSSTNGDFPYDFLPSGGNFDTGNTSSQFRITGAQIRIRAYDPRTRSTRQTTIIVDL